MDTSERNRNLKTS